jgi:N-acetyl-anhydromuramyl-L-alanine amidase AmpD
VVKHFVLHSFGHAWHSAEREGKRVGWMNVTKKGRGVTGIPYEGRTIYIPKGSDKKSMAHFSRFKNGLRCCLNSAARATAHFWIDRDGNIVIVGDCNDQMYTSNGLNISSCGVELEEAFYVLKDTKGKGNKAVIKWGGNPPGTAGNIEYFAYSEKQLLTLAVLCKKLEIGFPEIAKRHVSFQERALTPADPPGYTMHDYIKGSKHMDVSPHFRKPEFWKDFFKLVDAQTQINSTNVFKPRKKYASQEAKKFTIGEPGELNTGFTERLVNYAKETVAAFNRATNLVETGKNGVNSAAGNAAARMALLLSNQVSATISAFQQAEFPLVDKPSDTLSTSADGKQLNTDDMW